MHIPSVLIAVIIDTIVMFSHFEYCVDLVLFRGAFLRNELFRGIMNIIQRY